MLFERIDAEVAPMRSTYQALIDNPGKIEDILLAGAQKARKLATPFTAELRRAVGLRRRPGGPGGAAGARAGPGLAGHRRRRRGGGPAVFCGGGGFLGNASRPESCCFFGSAF
jgi:tryptophanyl-tRNA synthetase